MLLRRHLLAAAPASVLASPALTQKALAQQATVQKPAVPVPQRPAPHQVPRSDWDAFIAGVKTEARGRGIRQATLDRAFVNVHYNAHIIELDRNQPEFRKTWQQYRAGAVSEARIARGRQLLAQNRELMAAISNRYGVSPGVIMGVWGMESDYGRFPGNTYVIEALSTLAFDPRRSRYFRAELIDALRILDEGDVTPEQMTGSFAGAMGPTQFMPSSFWRYAVDYSGTGKRDIWNDLGDILASTANNLAVEGWRAPYPWAVPAILPPSFDLSQTGRKLRRPMGEWARLGVRTRDGRMPGPPEVMGAVIVPGGPGDEIFLAYSSNYQAIYAYNPADFYCCAVGLIGDGVAA